MRFLLTTIFWFGSFVTLACAQDGPARTQQTAGTTTASAPATQQATTAQPLPADRNKYAVIITGISGEETYAKQFATWTDKLRTTLQTKLGFAEDQTLS